MLSKISLIITRADWPFIEIVDTINISMTERLQLPLSQHETRVLISPKGLHLLFWDGNPNVRRPWKVIQNRTMNGTKICEWICIDCSLMIVLT